MAVGLLVVTVGAAAQTHKHDAPSVFGSAEDEVRSLAINVDSAIKLCTGLSGMVAAGRADISGAERRSTQAGIFSWIADPSAELKAQAVARRGSARFGRWFDPHASIWIIAYEKVPSCEILVGGSPWTSQVRPVLYAKIQDDNFWKAEGPEQQVAGKVLRAVFAADVPQMKNVRPLITVTAPIKATEGGTQLAIGVHVVNKEGK
jgi:hypothetical protein